MSIVTIIIYIAVILVGGLALNLGGWWLTLRLIDRVASRLQFPIFVAVRHLRGRKSGFLTAIGVLSILGVSVSSCALTSVLSVMGGFSGDLKDKILKTNAHVVVDAYGQDMERWQEILERVRAVPGVRAATPIVEGEMMMNSRSNNHAIRLKGIDLATFTAVSGVLEQLEKGELESLRSPEKLFEKVRERRKRLYGDTYLDPDKQDPTAKKDPAALPAPVSPKQRVLPTIIVGRELSRTLRLYEGAEVNIISPLGGIGPSGRIPKSRPFRIGGIFFSGMYEFDNLYVYSSLEAAQQFMHKGDAISELQVAVDEPEKADTVAAAVRTAIGKGLRVRSWSTLNAPLFSALAIEKIVMFIFLSMAILVASFCIVATLTMLVLEKGAEVSVLMTLGATVKQVQAIFRFEGLLIGLVGTGAGLLVGLGLCVGLEQIGLPIDPEVWYIDKLPVRMEWIEFLLVGLASTTITLLATIYPAYSAAKLTPVEGLKND